MKYTPGPWILETITLPKRTIPKSSMIIRAENYGSFAFVYSGPRDKENAQLMSSAPDLLEALKQLVKVNEEWNSGVDAIIGRSPKWSDGYLEAARAAIAKAESK